MGRGQVADELGIAHEVGDAQALIRATGDAEVLLGDRIAPVDLQRGIDQHDAFGQRADRPAEALLVFKQPSLVLISVARR